MSITVRRVILWATAAIGAYVGVWAAFLPEGFYAAFPGFGRIWIAVDGPYNEHLIRDVGSLYLALAAASIVAAIPRRPDAARAVGVAWVVFGLPHFVYHATHFAHMAPVDVIGNVVGLGGSLLLGAALLLPPRNGGRADASAPARPERRADADTSADASTRGIRTIRAQSAEREHE
ncbi:hypothetical protein [Microbacterium sp. CJ88]|uniref:hypothetical protein n=1 Tax=Microbacterium sp. CJ88 TaxID=3445672 RepID=UPI003F65BF25